MLYGGRTIGGIYLDDIIGTLTLVAQHLQSLLGVVGCYDAIAHLTLDECGGGEVACVAQRNEVAIGTHTVGSACTGISTGNGSEGNLHIIHEVDVGKSVIERQAHCCSCGRHMLETCCCRQASGLLQLAHQLPAVECVQEVDVAGTAVENLDGEFAFLHIDARRLLVGVATVLEL